MEAWYTQPVEHWYYFLLLIAVGFAVGFINTLAGGGSLLSLPTLIFLGLPPAVANGTNRVAIVIQTALATAGFKSKGVSTYPFNAYLGISALIGAIIGAQIAVDIKGETFNRILAIIMIVVLVLIVFRPKIDIQGIAGANHRQAFVDGYWGFLSFWNLWRLYQCRYWIRDYPLPALCEPHDPRAGQCHKSGGCLYLYLVGSFDFCLERQSELAHRSCSGLWQWARRLGGQPGFGQ